MRKGDHTWPIEISYEKCPNCGYINESRERYIYHSGTYTKGVHCEKCHKKFIVSKVLKRIGPFFGEGDKAEVDWED